MNTKETKQLNFEDAYTYILRMQKVLNITEVARHIGVSRCVLQSALRGNKDKYGKPVKLPQKYNDAVINFVEKIQSGNLY